MLRIEGTAESNLLDTFYVVEATHTEYFFLWKENTVWKENGDYQMTWDQGSTGWNILVGHIDGDSQKPVCIDVMWSNIGGQKVLFYETSSRFVDHEMVRQWLTKHCPAMAEPRERFHTNAMNFHHCLHAIKDANKALQVPQNPAP